MNIAATIAKMKAAGFTPEAIVAALECLVIEPVQSGAARRQAAYRQRLGLTGPEWAQLRDAVLERDNSLCHYCGEYADTVDHVVPVSKGGDSSLGNLVAACRPCNRAKKDTDAEEFKEGRT